MPMSGPDIEGNLTVQGIMSRQFVGVSEADPLDDAVDLLLTEGTDAAVVMRGSEPVGVLTKSDALAYALEAGDLVGEVTSAMSAVPPIVSPTDGVEEAATALAEDDGSVLLVENGTELVGVVTADDVVNATAALVNGPSERDPDLDRSATPATIDEETDTATDATQSVCEVCGSLSSDLQQFNGQLLCPDCRDV